MRAEPIRIAINGFGRIGRHVLRRALTRNDVDVVAINNRGGDPSLLAHLFKHDSVLGRYPGEVRAVGNHLFIDGRAIPVFQTDNPELLPWVELQVATVVEATGQFTTGPLAALHRRAGAEKVLVTAPMRGDDVTLVVGANERAYDPARHQIVSGASCTTMCLAPIARVIDERYGIIAGHMMTVHAYTNDQELVDGTSWDPRRARAAALNIAPTKTGAARLLGKVLPQLAGRIEGLAVRVPVPDVSLLDLSVRLERPASAEHVNATLREASNELPGILATTDEPLVSSDLRGDERSAVIDLACTRVAGGDQLNVLAWYDNEWAYACRMVDLVALMAGENRSRSKLPHRVRRLDPASPGSDGRIRTLVDGRWSTN